MRRHLYILSLLTALAATSAMARDVVNINARWTFFTQTDTHTDNSPTVYLPYTWNSDAAGGGGGSYYRGVGNFAKDVYIPAEWSGKRVFIRIGGAATIADVFVNGNFVGVHYGGEATFAFELTRFLNFGQSNYFRIVVNNAADFDVMPIAGQANVYGGIYRDVELMVCDPLSVSPAVNGVDGIKIIQDKITDNRAEITVSLDLLSIPDTVSDAIAKVRVLDAEDNVVAADSLPLKGSDAAVRMPLSVSKPHLWQGTDDPYLYNVEVTLSRAGTSSPDSLGRMRQIRLTVDSLVVRTGFRTVAVNGKNDFVLNGKAMKLRGVVLHRDRMMVGSAVTPFQIEEDVALVREMGANAVRVVGGRHNDYFYDLCNEAGIMVWNDGPFTGASCPTDIDFIPTERFRANGREQLREMIGQLYNHPSVVMWGLFSDISARGEGPVEYVRGLDSLAHLLDPGRLTVGSSVQNGELNFITDLIVFNQSLGWEENRPDAIKVWAQQLKKGWPNLKTGLTYSAGGSIFHQSEQLEKPVVMSGRHPEGWQTYFHEEYVRSVVDDQSQFWGVFVGNMFDFGSARYTWGDGRGINDHGLVTFDRKDRKDAFWLYKAIWNTSDPFVYIAGKRLDSRTARTQAITVYSNQPEVELLVGGRSVGKHTGKNGIFRWESVSLRPGINRLEARSGTATDRATITLR